jgi:diketogulonate reductase-like aldo/keto reductase
MNTIQLNNGVAMPSVGLGVFQSSPKDTAQAVAAALATGYRLIDTAAAYQNEAQVGEGIRLSGLPRDAIFVETKLWMSDYGYDQALHGFDRSMRKLGLDTLDLYLLHWPMPSQFERTVEAWRAAERLLAEGRTRAIGQMNHRYLGRSALKVSPLCLGAMMFGGETDEATSQRIIDKAFDAGVNFIDTADVYHAGRSEEVVGRAIASRRDHWVVATKFGLSVSRRARTSRASPASGSGSRSMPA